MVFDDLFVPDDHVLGEIDMAWRQATSELAYERSGPERFLETSGVLFELVRVLGTKPDARGAEGSAGWSRSCTRCGACRVSVNGMLQAGKEPVLEGSIVKDVGTVWEQELPAVARDLAAFVDARQTDRKAFDQLLRHAMTIAPKLTMQGGTTECCAASSRAAWACADIARRNP